MFDMNKRAGSKESPSLPEAEPRFPENRNEPPASARVREAAVIGPSIHIEGDLRGEEDLIIEGEVTGTIHLTDHSLTVGSKGKIHADVYAHTIVVDGTLEGDLYGAERVAIRKSGQVRGNIVSPRVSLEDGGRFKGSVEMDGDAVAKVFGRSKPQPQQQPSGSGGGSQSQAAGAGGGEPSRQSGGGSASKPPEPGKNDAESGKSAGGLGKGSATG